MKIVNSASDKIMTNTLDPTDIKILNILQQDARLDIKQIADQVHKSTSPVHERIRKLQNLGYIKRYVAILDREKIGKPLLAIAQVSLSAHTKLALMTFEEQINQQSEVQLCLHLSGACDFVLHIAVSDTQCYYDFLVNQLCNLPHVINVQTCFVLKECKTHSPYVL
jgi:Lrp/AsnC family leucine-responsive transcriptional regulator